MKSADIRGFSLIEAVAAIAVLALMSGGVLAVFSQGFNAAKRTGNQAAAVSLARAAAEEYLIYIANGIYDQGDITLNKVVYSRTIQISDYSTFPGQLKRLDAVISWSDGAAARSFTVSTLKAEY